MMVSITLSIRAGKTGKRDV